MNESSAVIQHYAELMVIREDQKKVRQLTLYRQVTHVLAAFGALKNRDWSNLNEAESVPSQSHHFHKVNSKRHSIIIGPNTSLDGE